MVFSFRWPCSLLVSVFEYWCGWVWVVCERVRACVCASVWVLVCKVRECRAIHDITLSNNSVLFSALLSFGVCMGWWVDEWVGGWVGVSLEIFVRIDTFLICMYADTYITRTHTHAVKW